MTRENWERLRNLSFFKLWVTDRQLRRLWPLALLIAVVVFVLSIVNTSPARNVDFDLA